MDKKEKASVSIVKIIAIALIIICLTGIGVWATNANLINVKILLSNGYEMSVITTKTKVEDILKENSIILLDDEVSIPALDEEISDNKTIKVCFKSDVDIEIAEVEPVITKEEILSSYGTTVVKFITEQEPIPYETITKEATGEQEGTKQNRVIQSGRDGLREVTYKVTYKDDVEIERIEISSEIIKEPVEKIIQVQVITTRSADERVSVTYSNGVWTYSESNLDLICAITAQECSSSYDGALAVITCACNRAESRGTDPLTEYKRKGQFCYSIDTHWQKRLNGNYSSVVKEAVLDALSGARNHCYFSFRSASTGHYGENIGGNVYF